MHKPNRSTQIITSTSGRVCMIHSNIGCGSSSCGGADDGRGVTDVRRQERADALTGRLVDDIGVFQSIRTAWLMHLVRQLAESNLPQSHPCQTSGPSFVGCYCCRRYARTSPSTAQPNLRCHPAVTRREPTKPSPLTQCQPSQAAQPRQATHPSHLPACPR